MPLPPTSTADARFRSLWAAIALLAVTGVIAVGVRMTLDRPPAVVVGMPQDPSVAAAAPGATVVPPPVSTPAPSAHPAPPSGLRGTPIGTTPEPGPVAGLAPPDGAPWRPAIQYRSGAVVPEDLVFVLVLGSDARPGEPLDRSRADSIHLVGVDPRTGAGTVLGLPRDAWVEIPGHGQGKINTALQLGGPQLQAETVHQLTGLPVDYWVLTGFDGLAMMVDAVGGVDVPVERRMADPASGALFERGWHRFDGREALAFSRDRHDVAQGDFTRSTNQGLVLLAALHEAKATLPDVDGVRGWLRILLGGVQLDVPQDRLEALAVTARLANPDAIANVVAPGEVGTVGKASVVFLTEEAVALFDDLRADAVVGGAAGDAPPDRRDGAGTVEHAPPSASPTPTPTTTPPSPPLSVP